MTVSRTVSAGKSSEYAIAASKGFSYYLPKSAQRHLQDLLKQLPSTARGIYNEYYRDLMCAKACAPDSAVAMAEFIIQSFPAIARTHNDFAREMNKEIDGDEHEGYVPVKFPIVAEREVEVEERPRKKRKVDIGSADAHTTATVARGSQPFRRLLPIVAGDDDPGARPEIGTTSATTPPTSSQTAQGSKAKTTQDDVLRDTDTLQQISDSKYTNKVIHEPHLDYDRWQLRDSSLLSDASPSEVSENKDPSVERPLEDGNEGHDIERAHRGSAKYEPSLPNSPKSDHITIVVNKEHPYHIDRHCRNSTPPHDTRLSEISNWEDTGRRGLELGTGNKGNEEEEDETSRSLASEEERWEDGLKAIEEFGWDRRGSRRAPGRGLVSIHFDDTERPTALFSGCYWADKSEEVSG